MIGHDGYRAMVFEPLKVPAPDSYSHGPHHIFLLSRAVTLLLCQDDELKLVEVKVNLTRDIRTYTFEGPRLPAWQRGCDPRSFWSFAEFKKYRALRRIYDIRWPADDWRNVNGSDSIVRQILDRAGRPIDVRDDSVNSFTGRREPYLVSDEALMEQRYIGLNENVL